MDKKIIEELDIIIRAQVESARKDIKKVVKDTKEMASSVSKSMAEINKSGKLDGFKKQIQQITPEMEEVEQKLGTVIKTVKAFGKSTKIEVKADMSDYESKLKSAVQQLKQLKEQSNISFSSNSSDTSSQTSSGDSVQNIKVVADTTEAENKISELQNNLNSFNMLTVREQIRTIGMQIEQLIPPIGVVRQALSSAFETLRIGDAFAGLKMGIDVVSQKIDSIKTKFGTIASDIKSKIAPVTSIFSNIGITAKQSFNDVKNRIKESADTTGTPLNKLKTLINKIKDVKKESEESKKKSSTLGTDIGKGLTKGIKSIKRFALSLLSIRSAFSMVSRACSSYLSFDTELQNSIQNSWNVLGSLFAPLLEYVAGLFNQLVSAVAKFVQSLTGINLVAKANAKALKKQEEATKKAASASKSLSGIDDIDTLSSGSSAQEPTTIEVTDVDIKPLEDFLAKAKNIFVQLFNPIKEAWNKSGKGVIDGIMSAFSGLAEFGSSVFGSLFEVWTNGTGMETMSLIFDIFGSIFEIIGEISSALSEAWNKNNTGTQIIQNVWNCFNNLLAIIKSVFDTIKNKWKEIGQPVCDVVMEFFKTITGLWADITNVLKEIWEKGGKYLFEKLMELGAKFVEIALTIYNKFIAPIISWFVNKIVPAIAPLMKALGNIIDVGMEIIDFIKNVFTGNWSKAFENIKNIIKGCWDFIKNIFSAGGKIFSGIVDGIASAFQTIVNAIIKGINKVIKVPFDVVNGLLNTIRNCTIPIIDVKPFKGLWDQNPLPVPQIPELATGNVAYEKTTAIFGEYANARQNPEVTSPVSLMAETFRNVLSEFDLGGTRIDTLKIDVAGDNFYQGTVDYINGENVRKGVNIIKEVGVK